MRLPPHIISRDRRALSFLRQGPLVRRPRGWRFGTAAVRDAVVDRLLADGRAIRADGMIFLAAATIGAAE